MVHFDEKPVVVSDPPPGCVAANGHHGQRPPPVADQQVVVLAHTAVHLQYVVGAVTTDSVHEAKAQVALNSTVAKFLAAFATLTCLFGVSIFLLNVIPVGQGVKVYSDSPSSSSRPSVRIGDRRYKHVNFYPGIWYGLLTVLGNVGLLYVCYKTLKRTRNHGSFIFKNMSLRSVATMLMMYFVLLLGVGISAMAIAAGTVRTIDLHADSLRCRTATALDGYTVCSCSTGPYIAGVSSCNYVVGTLSAVYRSIAFISAVLVVINIVIVSLLCGAMHCCKASKVLYRTKRMQQTQVVVAGMAVSHGYPLQRTAQATAPPPPPCVQPTATAY